MLTELIQPIGHVATAASVGHGLIEFPLPETASPLTVGPDGNVWFTEYYTLVSGGRGGPGTGSSVSYFDAIGRITLAGSITRFPLPASNGIGPSLTVGPDGNIWFPQAAPGLKPGSIGRVNLAPRVTKVVAVADSQGAITSLLVSFDKAMEPASAAKAHYYGLASGVERGQTIVYRKRVKIARVSYDRAAHAVRLKLAVPQKGPVQVTVRAGIVAADGISSSSDFTAVVM